MAQTEVTRFVREYVEKLVRELTALSRKAPTPSLRAAILSLAFRQIAVLEVLRAVMRILDRFETVSLVEHSIRSATIQEKIDRDDLERFLTKLVELESYQREVPRLFELLEQSTELDILRKILSLLRDESADILNELRVLIDSTRKEIEGMSESLRNDRGLRS